MASIISLINLKGGVGKTTTALALADIMAYVYKYRVLVVDLDPQTNVTITLMDQKEWEKRDNEGKTLKQLFRDAQYNTDEFHINDAIVKNVSNVSGGIQGLDLLPSSLGLIEIQDTMPLISVTSSWSIRPTEVLKRAIAPIINNYDIIIIDCPPNLGAITLNGILISNYYLIPTIPDVLSTYGIPQITKKVEQYAKHENIKIEPLGIVITKYRSNVNLHNTVLSTLEEKAKAGIYPRIFKTKIPFTVKAEEAADYNMTVNTLKQKYGYQGLDDIYIKLVEEIHEYV